MGMARDMVPLFGLCLVIGALSAPAITTGDDAKAPAFKATDGGKMLDMKKHHNVGSSSPAAGAGAAGVASLAAGRVGMLADNATEVNATATAAAAVRASPQRRMVSFSRCCVFAGSACPAPPSLCGEEVGGMKGSHDTLPTPRPFPHMCESTTILQPPSSFPSSWFSSPQLSLFNSSLSFSLHTHAPPPTPPHSPPHQAPKKADSKDDDGEDSEKEGFWKHMIGGSSMIDDGQPHKPSVSPVRSLSISHAPSMARHR